MAATGPAAWPRGLELTRFAADGRSGPATSARSAPTSPSATTACCRCARTPGVGARPSYAVGGLSNVWGAGILPYADRDLSGWPITASDLTDGYRAVLELRALRGRARRARASAIRSSACPTGRCSAPRRASSCSHGCAGIGPALGAAGYHFGASRLAVRVGHPAPGNGCSYCGHCLDGCPYGHIYNAAETIEQMRREGRDRLPPRPARRPDPRSRRRGARRGHAPRRGGRRTILRAPRVFLAAGAVSSTVILQRSGCCPTRGDTRQPDAVPALRLGRARGPHRARARPHPRAELPRARRPRRRAPTRCTSPATPTTTASQSAPAPPTRASARCSARRSTPSPAAWSWGSPSSTPRLPPDPLELGPGEPTRSTSTRCSTRARPPSSPACSVRCMRSLAPIGLVPLTPVSRSPPPAGATTTADRIPMREHAA